MRRLAALVLAALLFAACGSFVPAPPSSPAFDADIQVVNDTKLAVTVVVNGAPIGTVPAFEAASLPDAALPAKPWSIEARSPSGRVLLAFTVEPGQAASSTEGGVTTMSGAGSRADLSCGRLDVTVGAPLMGPAPAANPGAPGDCDP